MLKFIMVFFLVLEESQGGAEGMQLEELTNKISTFEFAEDQDSWSWNLDGEGVFSVSSARRIIDDGLSVLDGSPTIWLKLILIKVNILAWRLASNKLPTRFNMSLRGLEVSSIECPVCHEGVETSDHLFFSCSVSSAIVSRFLGWWGLPNVGISSYQGWLTWFNGLRLRKEVKDYLEGTMFVLWWIIWRYRNKLIFCSDVPTKASLFDLIVYHSYVWCNARVRRNLDWLGWLKSPMIALL